jgi:hypothetical protein
MKAKAFCIFQKLNVSTKREPFVLKKQLRYNSTLIVL